MNNCGWKSGGSRLSTSAFNQLDDRPEAYKQSSWQIRNGLGKFARSLVSRPILFRLDPIFVRCPMRKQVGRILYFVGIAALTMSWLCSGAIAADTMADWTGANNVTPAANPNNNYVVISNSSVGGAVQA